tara:strand:- start:1244 stop:1381 length:138 start_codon:yes stop_codon:yes gene_type:complete
MKKINYLGMVFGIIAISLAWMWFGWKMPLVMLLFITGNNMEGNGR